MTTKDLLRILWQIDGVTRYNTLIYWLQKLPLIGRRIPQACYRLKRRKSVFNRDSWSNISLFYSSANGSICGYLLYLGSYCEGLV